MAGSVRKRRRRRFLVVSVAALAVLAASLGVSFAGPIGSTSVELIANPPDFVFPVATGKTVPDNVLRLKYTTSITASSLLDASGDADTAPETITTAVTPAWTPITNSAGEVTTVGDIALIDARNTGLLVSLFVTDLTELQLAYSSFALTLKVWKCTPSVSNPCNVADDWTQAGTGVIPADGVLLTHNEGFQSFSLPVGSIYDITIELGGSFYSIDASDPDNNGPEFFFSAQPT